MISDDHTKVILACDGAGCGKHTKLIPAGSVLDAICILRKDTHLCLGCEIRAVFGEPVITLLPKG